MLLRIINKIRFGNDDFHCERCNFSSVIISPCWRYLLWFMVALFANIFINCSRWSLYIDETLSEIFTYSNGSKVSLVISSFCAEMKSKPFVWSEWNIINSCGQRKCCTSFDVCNLLLNAVGKQHCKWSSLLLQLSSCGFVS